MANDLISGAGMMMPPTDNGSSVHPAWYTAVSIFSWVLSSVDNHKRISQFCEPFYLAYYQSQGRAVGTLSLQPSQAEVVGNLKIHDLRLVSEEGQSSVGLTP